ncbi:hypothetical protein CASFOL_031389 [Castilleja foliolosa]|uniref:Gnk2-homologous domain-containing protein n=1 Tax=Castilleja foliolosa TaxID=1961234 RepID=A0ABD3C5V2_9LAMI
MDMNMIMFIFYVSHLLMIITSADPIENHNVSLICSSTKGNSNYTKSVKYLLDDLNANAPIQKGYWDAYWFVGAPADWPYGLALCYGNVTTEYSKQTCKTCLSNAAMNVMTTNKCSNSRAAIIWLDQCLLKYADKPFLGQIDTDQKFYSFDHNYMSLAWSDTVANTTLVLLDELVVNATTNQTGKDVKLFAYNTVHDENKYTVVGMVQCTGDLSIGNCGACLNATITDLRRSDKLKSGGKLISGSCLVVYHILNRS